ncbi:cation transporter [Rickettsiales bacterium]|nr:cation transporter [Rickettsiales bacterium]
MRLFLSILLVTFFVILDYKVSLSETKIEEQTVRVSVNGLVCDFCARSIEKLFSKKESVDSINVNLEKMLITINLKIGKVLNDDTIKEVIRNSGYDVTEIYREK